VSLPFLLEIGTEEIPDWMIKHALNQLAEGFQNLLKTNQLAAPMPRIEATPRRLVVIAPVVPERTPDRDDILLGPAPHLGYSAGAPMDPATEGWIRKNKLNIQEIYIQETSKGRRWGVTRRIPGRALRAILAESLPAAVLGIEWPKKMYWTEKNGPRFIRPIRWIVALLGDEVIPFEIAGVKSGNVTSGHRVLGAAQIPLTIENYEQKLRENFVILSADERERRIRAGIGNASDEGLLQTLVNLTEYPTVISGSFDPEYLKLPAEVLVTVMKHHQKYFAVYENGQLTNRFLAVTNTDGDPDGIIQRGNERVLRARFNDAKFFWQFDQRKKLEDRIVDLDHVTFQAQLGSYRLKVGRMVEMARYVLGEDRSAMRAAQLCKCDLTTEMVKEFTELQGVVGGLYAREQGEPEEVWQAIYDHYKPVSMEDSIPRNRAGQLVSLADKLDTLTSCFAIGLIPSGSKDPFALRRAAQGIVKILVEGKLRFSLKKLLPANPKLEDFFLDRVRYYFKDIRGFKYDEVNAVLASGWDDLVDVEERLVAIQAVRPTEDFEPLAASFKRIQNILKQAQFTGGSRKIGGNKVVEPGVAVLQLSGETPEVKIELLEPGPESELYKEFQNVLSRVAKQPYRPALEMIASLRPKVDLFFDKVLVNAPDAKIRQNRLTLLHTLLAEFSTIADFSEIVTNA
jgi:glycyl-tRNA synthetase beta chain